MRDLKNCVICNKPITKGNDPAVCDNDRCLVIYEYEVTFNRFAAREKIIKEALNNEVAVQRV